MTEVRRFLGIINQLSKFSLHLAERSKPIRDLLSTKNHWNCGPDQEKSFNDLKTDLNSGCVLALYEPDRESRVSADALSYGLGAILRQKQLDGKWKPIAYISRSMTETELRYAQFEKVAVTWACERLSQYLVGTTFEVETDHKPLVPLLSTKNLADLPLCLQRFRLRMMRYKFSIRHVSGKKLNTADFLSRSPLNDSKIGDNLHVSNEVEAYIHI